MRYFDTHFIDKCIFSDCVHFRMPSTFWITNPKTIMRNNVAAGSDVSENKWRRKFLPFLFINAFARTLIMVFIQHTCIIFYQYAGIWYVFPDEPIGASYGIVKTMQKDEAKRTPITEFTNNVVHSNRVVSISIHCTVGQMLQRIIHRRLTIKKALIDYNVEEKN